MRTRRKWWFWGMWVALPCTVGAALWSAAATAAATAVRMECISSGCGLQAGSRRGPAG